MTSWKWVRRTIKHDKFAESKSRLHWKSCLKGVQNHPQIFCLIFGKLAPFQMYGCIQGRRKLYYAGFKLKKVLCLEIWTEICLTSHRKIVGKNSHRACVSLRWKWPRLVRSAHQWPKSVNISIFFFFHSKTFWAFYTTSAHPSYSMSFVFLRSLFPVCWFPCSTYPSTQITSETRYPPRVNDRMFRSQWFFSHVGKHSVTSSFIMSLTLSAAAVSVWAVRGLFGLSPALPGISWGGWPCLLASDWPQLASCAESGSPSPALQSAFPEFSLPPPTPCGQSRDHFQLEMTKTTSKPRSS